MVRDRNATTVLLVSGRRVPFRQKIRLSSEFTEPVFRCRCRCRGHFVHPSGTARNKEVWPGPYVPQTPWVQSALGSLLPEIDRMVPP